MEITRAGAKPSGKGSNDWFTGSVRIDPLFNPHDAERVQGASVAFEPGAHRMAHSSSWPDALGLAGVSRAQQWGGEIKEIRPGDVVWFSPGEKHWHGAGPTTAMTHIAIHEVLDGKAVDWLEKVTDEQYRG